VSVCQIWSSDAPMSNCQLTSHSGLLKRYHPFVIRKCHTNPRRKVSLQCETSFNHYLCSICVNHKLQT